MLSLSLSDIGTVLSEEIIILRKFLFSSPINKMKAGVLVKHLVLSE